MRDDDRARFDPTPGAGGTARPSPALALGGGAGAIVVIVIALLFGVDPGRALRGGAAPGPAGERSGPSSCTRGPDLQRDRDCRVAVVAGSLQDYWAGVVLDYRALRVSAFTGSVDTGCGTATAGVGPFYCPADTTVHLDLGHVDRLTARLGGARAAGAAEAYLLAHAFGHHVQHLDGTAQRVVRPADSGPASPDDRLELQADCYAGAWFAHVSRDPGSPVAEVGLDELERAVDAAVALGEEAIQRQRQARAAPDPWHRGSPADRRTWLRQGRTTGDPARCDTFAADAPR